MIGGWGFWTGFGHDQLFSNCTCSPEKLASSFVQISFISRIFSRKISRRCLKSRPWLRISSRFQP